MLEKVQQRSNAHSAAIHSALFSSQTAPQQPTGATHLNTAIGLYAAIEFITVACSAYLASILYHYAILGTAPNNAEYVFASLCFAAIVFIVSFTFHNFSALRRQARHVFLWRGLGAVALAFPIFLTILFLAQFSELYSRGTFLFQAVAISLAVACSRTLFYSWLQFSIKMDRIEAGRVVIVGDTADYSELADRLRDTGITIVGSFPLPRQSRAGKKTQTFIKSEIHEIITECRSVQVDDIIILAEDANVPALLKLASHFGELPVGVHIIPVTALNVFASVQIGEFGNIRTIQVYRMPLSPFELLAKRAFDIIFATIGLIGLSPLFLMVSIAIKLESRGPIFFRQLRHGFNNKEIRVLKFRSMTVMESDGPFTQAVKNDPRVTRIGQIIRATNIDELPQLLNVLRGEMSIVGPRPHAVAHNALFSNMILPFSRRHNVKPGITGWAQVNGFRGATDTYEKMKQRIVYDLHYVDNWSLLLDLKIIFMTLFSKRAYSNAY